MNGGGSFLKYVALLATIIGALFTIVLPLYSRNSPVASQVQSNAEQVEIINQDAIRKEKICSESNPDACRDLFNRLAMNITTNQRFRLGCAVLIALDIPETKELIRKADCPPLLYPPDD